MIASIVPVADAQRKQVEEVPDTQDWKDMPRIITEHSWIVRRRLEIAFHPATV
jgi:hypothetical protein